MASNTAGNDETSADVSQCTRLTTVLKAKDAPYGNDAVGNYDYPHNGTQSRHIDELSFGNSSSTMDDVVEDSSIPEIIIVVLACTVATGLLALIMFRCAVMWRKAIALNSDAPRLPINVACDVESPVTNNSAALIHGCEQGPTSRPPSWTDVSGSAVSVAHDNPAFRPPPYFDAVRGTTRQEDEEDELPAYEDVCRPAGRHDDVTSD